MLLTKLRTALLLFLILPLTATAEQVDKDNVLNLVRTELEIPDVFSGKFLQQKFLRDMPFPIDSNGYFEFSPTAGLRWHIHSPIESELRITKDTLTQYDGDREVFHLDSNSQPSATIFIQLFYAVFSGDWATLDQYFSVNGDYQPGHWSLQLFPKSPALAGFANKIEIRGGRYLQEFSMDETSGDRTHVTFTDFTPR